MVKQPSAFWRGGGLLEIVVLAGVCMLASSCGGRSAEGVAQNESPCAGPPGAAPMCASEMDATSTATPSTEPPLQMGAGAPTAASTSAATTVAQTGSGTSSNSAVAPTASVQTTPACGGLDQACCEAPNTCSPDGLCLDIEYLPCGDSLACCGGSVCLKSCLDRSSGTRNPNARYRGRWLDFVAERRAFIPCGDDFTLQGWWLPAPREAPGYEHVAQLREAFAPEIPNSIYVELDGELSEPGEWGHEGAYSQQLVVTQIYFASYAPEPLCAWGQE